MNLKKFERIAAELEKQLGIEEAGDELIDKAEDAVEKGADSLPEAIDDGIEQEKKEEALPPPALEASDDNEKLAAEIEEAEQAIDNAEQAQQEADDVQQVNDDIADLEQQLDNADAPAEPVDDGNDAVEAIPVEPPKTEEAEEYDDAKPVIASLKRLARIAKAVKMSKDLPATKKEEVLGKIQKASDKLRKAAFGGAEDEDAAGAEPEHPAIQTFISIFNTKRGKLNSIMKGRGRGNQRIRSLLGDGFDNKMIGTMTLAELFSTLGSILAKLK